MNKTSRICRHNYNKRCYTYSQWERVNPPKHPSIYLPFKIQILKMNLRLIKTMKVIYLVVLGMKLSSFNPNTQNVVMNPMNDLCWSSPNFPSVRNRIPRITLRQKKLLILASVRRRHLTILLHIKNAITLQGLAKLLIKTHIHIHLSTVMAMVRHFR